MATDARPDEFHGRRVRTGWPHVLVVAGEPPGRAFPNGNDGRTTAAASQHQTAGRQSRRTTTGLERGCAKVAGLGHRGSAATIARTGHGLGGLTAVTVPGWF